MLPINSEFSIISSSSSCFHDIESNVPDISILYTLQEILNYLIDVVGLDKGSRVYFIKYLKEGLNLKMKNAMKIGAWDYFENGTRKIEEIEKELQPLITLSLASITVREKSQKKDFFQ